MLFRSGDNCFETDGAEDSDWQPVTTTTIYNATVVGQPVSGDHATAWRDNARVQYRNCVFMDIGDRAVSFDNIDTDGANGYGFNGTLSWADTWTTPYTATSAINAPANPAAFYTTQSSGNLAEITDSVFFRVANYSEANARGVFNPANNNTQILSSADADAPIMSITRGTPVAIPTSSGTLTMLPVISIDPRPKNQPLTSIAAAPADGFFTPAFYRGGFEPNVAAWPSGWTASDAFGFTGGGDLYFDVCSGDGGDQMGCSDCPCNNNAPIGTIGGCLNPASTSARLLPEGIPSVAADTMRFEMSGGVPSSFAVLTSGGALAPNSPANPCFGLDSGLPAANLDGLRCVVQGVQRHGVRPVDAQGNVGVTGAGWGPPNGPAGGLIAQGGFVSGQIRHYQVIYRVDPMLGCMRGQQTSQAVTVTFLP